METASTGTTQEMQEMGQQFFKYHKTQITNQ